MSTLGDTSVLWRVFSTVGKIFNFGLVAIKNDEKISIFFVLRNEIFIWKFKKF